MIGVVLILLFAIFSGLFFPVPKGFDFIGSDDDEDEKIKSEQLLVYDPTGNNLVKSSGTRQSGSSIAYFVNIEDGKIKSYTEVDISSSVLSEIGYDPNNPAVISGDFELSGDGSTIEKITQKTVDFIEDGNFIDFEFSNIQASLSSVSVVVKDHTFGFGYGKNGDPIAYISMDKKPTFFTDVKIKGIVLPKNIADAMNFLDAAISAEFTDFKETFNQFANAANLPNFELGLTIILADEIKYDTTLTLQGDVIDIFTPSDASNLLKTLNSNIDEETYKFISDILNNINMELIVMMEPQSTMNDLTLWLVMGITDLDRSETHGLVTLNVAEITEEDIERELGIDIPDQQIDTSIKIKFGVTGDDDFTPVLAKKEVRELWPIIESSSDTAAGSVKTDCFAMVMTLDDVITYMEAIFQTDMATLKAITGVRNPGAGLIIDYNFTEVLDDANKPFEKYFGLILMPDFKLDPEQLIYLTTIEGVVYDLGKFLENEDFTFPVIISDQVTEGPAPKYYDLDDVYDGALGARAITPFSTYGYATGTTLKTVAQYAQYVFPPAALITKSPVDICAYHLYQPAGDDYRYHTALFGFNLTKDKGPTYFLQNVSVQGFYINISKFMDRVSDAMGFGDTFGVRSLISDIIQTVGEFTGDRFLDGAIVAYKIAPRSMEQDIKVTELHCYSTYIRNDNVKIFIKGNIKCINGLDFTPSVRITITPELGDEMLFYEGKFSVSEEWQTLPSIIMTPGDTAFFKYENGFNASELPAGNYSVDVHLMHWTDIIGLDKKLGEAHGSFRIFTAKEEVGYKLNHKSADVRWDLEYDVEVNITLNSTRTTVINTPKVNFWSEWFYVPVFTYDTVLENVPGTDEWMLSEVWPSTAYFHFYIVFEIEFQNNQYELMTEIFEV